MGSDMPDYAFGRCDGHHEMFDFRLRSRNAAIAFNYRHYVAGTHPAGFIAPCLPTKTDKLRSGSQWLHEIEDDGFRIIARKDGPREKRAWASRPSGRWNDEDYDVLADGAVVGRIFQAHAAPVRTPWMWTLAFGYHEDRTPRHVYAATRKAALLTSACACSRIGTGAVAHGAQRHRSGDGWGIVTHLQIMEADRQLTGRCVANGSHCWAMWIGATVRGN
jgi:hypothetical protein